MMKSEFEKLTKKEVTQEQYNIIETVYTFYPGIDDKQYFCNLYLALGPVMIVDLYPRAQRIEEIENQIRALQLEKCIARGGNTK